MLNNGKQKMKTHFGLDFYVLSSNKKFWEDVTGEKLEEKPITSLILHFSRKCNNK